MDRRGLGRGLEALISSALTDSESSGIVSIPLDQIQPNPYQPRTVFDAEAMAELTASIREHGVLQPILVRRVGIERYELIAGERRLRAAREAGLQVIPTLLRSQEDSQMLEIALIENVQREDIGAVEAARAYRRLVTEFGQSQESIAKRVGKSPASISNTLRLLALPEQILQSLASGEITEGHARAILQAGPNAMWDVWRRVKTQLLTVRGAERLARELRRIDVESPARPSQNAERERVPQRDANLASIEEALQLALGTKVTIRRAGAIGRLEIEFYSDAELEGIAERILGCG